MAQKIYETLNPNGGDWRSKSLALPLKFSTTLDGFYFANCVLAVRSFFVRLSKLNL